MGILRSGYGVLAVQTGDLLGISVSGHGDPGRFAGPWVLIGLFQRVATPCFLVSTPKILTVVAADGVGQTAGSPKALTVVRFKVLRILRIHRLSVHWPKSDE